MPVVLVGHIGHRADQRACGIVKTDRLPSRREGEVAVQIRPGAIGFIAVVAHHDEVSVGGNRGSGHGEDPFVRRVQLVGQSPASQIDRGCGGVAQFDPVAEILRVVIVILLTRRDRHRGGHQRRIVESPGGLGDAHKIFPRPTGSSGRDQ